MWPNSISPADKIIANYLVAIESGAKISIESLIAVNIEYERELREYFKLKSELEAALADDDPKEGPE